MLALSCANGQVISGGVVISGSVTLGTTPVSPSWVPLSGLPSGVTTNGATYSLPGDGYLYLNTHSGVAPTATNTLYRTSATSPGTYTDITGSGLSGTGGTPGSNCGVIGMTANATILATCYAGGSSAGVGNEDAYWWDGSSTWTKVTGWDGNSSSVIYNFTHDAAGYTYFSPAWSGDIWKSTSPNGTVFTKAISNVYGSTNGGATGHPTNGAIYPLRVYDLADGNGDMLWGCGEGELDNFPLAGPSSFTAYLTTAGGYTGNCTAIDKSATNILVLRTHSSTYLNRINIATRAVTTLTPSGFPASLDTNVVGSLHWMFGTTWMFSNRTNASVSVLLLSTDDGSTWTDLTAGLPAACTGTNLSIAAQSSANYIFARCQSGKVIWVYGPVS